MYNLFFFSDLGILVVGISSVRSRIKSLRDSETMAYYVSSVHMCDINTSDRVDVGRNDFMV